MKKGLRVLLVCLALSFVFTACTSKSPASKSAAEPPAKKEKKAITIRLANNVPVEHVENKASELFKKLVEEKSDGQIKVEVFPANQLGDQREQYEGVKMGTLEMTSTGVAMISTDFPKLSVLDIPYVIDDNDKTLRFIKTDDGKALIDEMVQKTGVRPLFYGIRGPREITSKKPIKSIDDLKGLKIRVPDSPALTGFFNEIGAKPVTMGFSEVYMGLQTNVIEAQENPLDMILTAKFYEVQKYVAMSDHTVNMSWFVINDKFYQGLPDDLKKIVDDASNECTNYVKEEVTKQQNDLRKQLEEKGMTFTEINKDELKEASKNLYKKFVGKDSFSEELYQKVKDFK